MAGAREAALVSRQRRGKAVEALPGGDGIDRRAALEQAAGRRGTAIVLQGFEERIDIELVVRR